MSLVDTVYLKLFQDENLFALVDAVRNKCDESQMTVEDRKYLANLHSAFLDNGLALSGEARQRSQEFSKRLIELRVAFTENLSSDPGLVWREEQDLEGLVSERIQALPSHPSNGQRGVPLKKTHVNAVLSSCDCSETRKDIFIQSENIFPENVKLFQEIIILRDERARLLGFESFAHQQARSKLLKSPQHVKSMLEDLSTQLAPIAKAELEVLQRMKDTSGPTFYIWDFDYCHDQMLRDN